MSRLLITTTGTSLASNILKKLNVDSEEKKELQNELFKNKEWDEDIEQLSLKIKEYLKNHPEDYGQIESRKKISAELKSLEYLDIKKSDDIILIATDTAQSRFICERLKEILIEIYKLNANQITIQRIEGLQTHDAEVMRTLGLRNLVGSVQKTIQDNRYSYQEIICNVTGGFKSVVPFITVLAMLYKVKTVYIFESSEQLITLPPLPFSFDLDLFEKVKPALQYIEQETAVSEQVYLNRIQNYTSEQKDLYLSFVEPITAHEVTLSPLAYSLLDIESNASTPKVTQKIVEEIENISNDESRSAIINILERCKSPLWREQKYHRFSGTDLLVLKPGNTAERVAGFIKKDIFYVCLIFIDHNKYEKELGNYQKSDFEEATFFDWNGERS